MRNFEVILNELYGEKAADKQKSRYNKALDEFKALYGGHEGIRIFSASGRSEIGGNHTDHNMGRVLAAAVDLDVIAFCIPSDDNIITVKSEGFPMDTVDIADLSVHPNEINTSAALIRGVACGFEKNGYKIGGFKAYTTSNVLKGSGISSSAAFEVLIGTILSYMYNEGGINAVNISKIGRYAENVFFGKPSGLMDQLASSEGGFITVDFKDIKNPVIESIQYDFSRSGYSLCIVDTKGSHDNLTPEYAAIPNEMKSVAGFFGKSELRGITYETLRDNIGAVREKCGDRAVLRAFHFFDENERVVRQANALRNGDINTFLKEINASADSSYKYLQNVYSSDNPGVQSVALGLYTAGRVLNGRGASRVHGGGFAGTIQAFVPDDLLDVFTNEMNSLFGENSCYNLRIRPVGGIEILYFK